MSNSPTNVPYRLSEKCFREYESIVKTAIDLLPSRLTIEPCPGRSQNTIEARLRDVFRSLHEFRWNCSVNMAKFEQYYDNLQVRREGETVIVCLRGQSEQPVLSPRTTTGFSVPRSKCNPSVIHACVVLAHNQVLSGIFLEGTKKDEVGNTAMLDVAVVEKDGGVVIL
jgi:hypothetical protein